MPKLAKNLAHPTMNSRTPAYNLALTLALVILTLVNVGFALTPWIQPPTLFLFKTSVAATEFGHLFAPVTAALALILFFIKFQIPKTLRLIASFLFCLSTVSLMSSAFQACQVARENGLHFSWKQAYFPARPTSAPVREVSFTRPDASQGTFYFYPPTPRPGAHAAPLVIIVHGGGWSAGHPLQFATLNPLLAQKGYAVASVDYRFAPEFKWPTQKNDVLAAIAFLRTHPDQYGIDPSRIVVLGRSAGGQLAEIVAFNPPAELKPAIRGCIGIYAPADLFLGYESGRENDILKSRTLLRNYLGGTPETARQAYHDASATEFVDAHSPSTLLLQGLRDTLVWYKHSEHLEEKMKAAGRPIQYLRFPWATHGMDVNPYGPAGQLSTQAILRFLETVMPTEKHPLPGPENT
jgi:acetyl esterase/lipase